MSRDDITTTETASTSWKGALERFLPGMRPNMSRQVLSAKNALAKKCGDTYCREKEAVQNSQMNGFFPCFLETGLFPKSASLSRLYFLGGESSNGGDGVPSSSYIG